MKYSGKSAKKTKGTVGMYSVNTGRLRRAQRATPLLIGRRLAHHPELHEDHEQEDREEEQRHRRPLSDLPALQAEGEGVRGEEVRHVHRAALGQDVDDVEVGQRE